MGSDDLQRSPTGDGAFADTVQFEPPVPAEALRATAAPDSVPAADSDLIGLDLGSDGEGSVAEQPTLSHIGRYALKSLLGEGGLGRVYEAWDPLLSRTVAVKTLQFDLDMPSRIALDRLLLNEARAAANLNHPHIVTVFDAGLSAHGVYIAMERLRGRDLRQMLAEGWRPAVPNAALIVRRVADALAYAHSRSVVHCDIKPGNIFVTRKDKPKVLDFGIARAAHASAVPSTEMTVAGSPHYLAPEQLAGGTIDARTDIYALGVVLYELLCGRKAFTGDNLEQIHEAVRAGRPVALQALCPEVPDALAALVAQAMATDPASRPGTAAEFSQALRPWCAGAPDAPADRTPAQSPKRAAAAKRRPWIAGVLGAAVLAAGATLVLRRAPTADATAASPAASVTASAAATKPNPTPAAAASPAATAAASATAAAPDVMAAAAAASAPAPAQAPATVRPALKITPTMVQASAAMRARPRAAAAEASTPAAEVATGIVQIAVSPWGEVEVDGRPAGTTPPLSRLTLPEGTHTITLRNADFPPLTTTVHVQADKPAVVRHRFGS